MEGARTGGAARCARSRARSAQLTSRARPRLPAPCRAARFIARSYYWETPRDAAAPPLPVVIVHNVHYFFSRVWSTAEYVGDFFSELFGLYNSRYEWALELERRHNEEAEEAELLEERRKRWDAMRASGARPTPVPVNDAAAPEAAGLLATPAEKEDAPPAGAV